MIRVLIVEDSPVARTLLVGILGSDPDISVVATAVDGLQAIEMALKYKPDVITMDLYMPRLGGVEAVRRIMTTNPIPTVVISAGTDWGGTEFPFLALEAGAVAVCEKPLSPTHRKYRAMAGRIVQTVKMASEIKLVRRWKKSGDGMPGVEEHGRSWPTDMQRMKVVAIGASTGGPLALCEILAGLSREFPMPILIVQHIAVGFLPGMVDWLSSTSGFPVKIADEGEIILPGHAYIAPDGSHMEAGMAGRLHLRPCDFVDGLCPSVSVLFLSVARIYDRSSIGILLTGMGKDGAEGLLAMKEKGALTIAQDKESSVIHGMPGEAIRLGAARFVYPPGRIAEMLNSIAAQRSEA